MNVLPKAGELWKYCPKDDAILLDGRLMVWPNEVVMILYDGLQRSPNYTSAYCLILNQSGKMVKIWEHDLHYFVKE